MGVIHGVNLMLRTPDESMSEPFLKAGFGWGTVILFTCIQPAIIEELAFRGVIFAGLTKALSGMETILVSALMFMVLHLSPLRFPHTLALGIGAGFLRYRTKSIYPCMLMHFSHNFLCIAGEWLATAK
jgi:membrane protease YdiL (CAAX protease family)